MKFTVGREALGEGVAFVSRALPARPVVPVLSGILLDATPGAVTLSCFDYEVSARVTVAAEVAETGRALVPGRLLAEITRSLPAGPAEFSADAEMVNLACGSAEFGLVCLPAADYPLLPASPPAVGAADGSALAAAVSQVAPSASRDDTLPMLTAVCLDVDGPVLTLAATDRYRLAAREMSFRPAAPDARMAALVPAKTMAEATRAMSSGTPVTIAFGADGEDTAAHADIAGRHQPPPAQGLISLESGDRRLTARLIVGDFIRYRARFGADYDCRADLPALPVIEAVRRAALVAERAGPVRLSFRPDHVVIEAHAEGRARAAETVPADFAGDQPVISFNPHFLLDGLTAAAAAGASGAVTDAADRPDGIAAGETGRIRLEFNTPAKPALITWVDADGRPPSAEGGTGVPAFRYLLVPLRVPERA